MANIYKASLVCITAFALFLVASATVLKPSGSIDAKESNEEQKTAIHPNEASVPLKLKHTLPRTVIASWYGDYFNGRLMADGKPFDMNEMTVAHKSLPLGTHLVLENPQNGRVILVTVTDRGPYVEGRELDLSKRAAEVLGIGLGPVKILGAYI